MFQHLRAGSGVYLATHHATQFATRIPGEKFSRPVAVFFNGRVAACRESSDKANYQEQAGIFRGKRKDGRLEVNVDSNGTAATTKLWLDTSEVRRARSLPLRLRAADLVTTSHLICLPVNF